jgi:endonuclease/exonuclease/phosphatase family metal-dependent hydrolase
MLLPNIPRRPALAALLALALPACYGATRGAATLSELTTTPGCRTASIALAPSVANGVVPVAPAIAADSTHGPSIETSIAQTVSSLPVSWIVSPDAAERPLLDRWCAGVGPVVAATHVDAAAPASVVSTGSLVVVTWNIHIGAGDVPGLVSDLKAGRFTGGKPVKEFVLLLQEVYRSSPDVPSPLVGGAPKTKSHTVAQGATKRVDIVETAHALGLELFYVPSMANGRPSMDAPLEDRGNAILSSLPLRDLTAIELPFEAQRRVAAAATVSGMTMGGKPWSLRLVNMHLDNKSRPSRFLQSLGSGRTRQARALVEVLAKDSAAVIGGDMNTWGMGFMEGSIGVLEQHFPMPSKHPNEATFAMAGLKLDRLMFRVPNARVAETRRLADRRGSDHFPLIGTIEFDE